MKDNFEFLEALQQIARDKGISVETLLDALANALVAAYKRLPDAAEEAVVTIDPESGEIRVYGQELDEDGNVIREWDDTPDDFGRIAAQTAKQVILQRIREAERDLKYEEYAGREGDIVTGIIQQTDNRYTLLDLGKVEALLPQAEQVPYERYEHGARLKAYIVEVRKTTKGPQIVVSRTHPGLIKRLFELEVPEISTGVVEIKAAAREPGHRTKIAVWSNDPNVDPVGACVGARGSRVRMVTNELRGEKVDIVPFSDDPVEFVMRALQPARVREVRLDEETGTATVDRQRLPAVPGHRQGGAERPPGRPPHRLAHRHQERDPAGRGGGGYANQEWAEGEWVEDEAGRDGLAAGRGRRGHVGRAVGRRRRRDDGDAEAEAAPGRDADAGGDARPASRRRRMPARRRGPGRRGAAPPAADRGGGAEAAASARGAPEGTAYAAGADLRRLPAAAPVRRAGPGGPGRATGRSVVGRAPRAGGPGCAGDRRADRPRPAASSRRSDRQAFDRAFRAPVTAEAVWTALRAGTVQERARIESRRAPTGAGAAKKGLT